MASVPTAARVDGAGAPPGHRGTARRAGGARGHLLRSTPPGRAPALPHGAALGAGSLLSFQRLAGNAAVASLVIQRCGGHACQGGCEERDEAVSGVQRVVQRDPDPPKSDQPAPDEPKPLCDFARLRTSIPAKGDSDPAPGGEQVDDADVAWVDDIKAKSPDLAGWLVPQIDRPYTVAVFERRAQAAVDQCEKPAKAKVKAIKDATKKAAAEAALGKQLELDRVELAKVVAEYTSTTAVGRGNYRKAFMRTMRCLLGPDPATKNHFSALEQVTPGLWLDAEAAARLRQVRSALQAAGQDLPSTDVGQGLRGHHLQNHQTGWWGHALGFSMDFFAYENPHITDPRTSRLIEMLAGDADRMTFPDDAGKEMDYPSRRAVIRAIGEKAAAGEDPTADPKMAKFLDQVDQQYQKMVEGSHKLQQDTSVLPAENRRQLEQLKHDYVDLEPRIAAARADLAAQQKAVDAARRATGAKLVKLALAAGVKQPKIDAATVDADPGVAPLIAKLAAAAATKDGLEAQKVALAKRLPTVFAPWLTRIKQEFLDLDAAAAGQGVVAARLPDLKGWRFNEIEAVLQQMSAREAQVPADRQTTDGQLTSLRKRIATDLQKITGALADPASLTGKPSAAVLAAVRLVRSFVWKRNDRPTMQKLYDGLSGDLTYTLGVVEAVPPPYRRADGDQYWLRPGYGFDVPVPVAQLLEKPGDRNAKLRVGGYIRSDTTGKAAFNQLLVRTMVTYGWEPGAAWLPGSVDTMHFDFVKAFDRVKISGGESCGPHGKT